MADIRIQKYKKNRLSGMNQYNAAVAAGYSESFSRSHGKKLEEKAKIADVLERVGLTDKYLANKALELVEAVDDILIRKTNVEGIIEVDKVGTVINWKARAQGLELVLKLKNLLQEKVSIDLNVNLSETLNEARSRLNNYEQSPN